MSAIIKERLELPSFYKKYCNSATAFDFGKYHSEWKYNDTVNVMIR